MRSVSSSDGGLRDRDIIFRDRMDLVVLYLVVLYCLVQLAGKGEFEFWQLSVSFFSLPTVLECFHDQTHTLTQTRKVRRDAERPKGDREQFASLDLWITD